jgi:uncharacterized protein DUF3617
MKQKSICLAVFASVTFALPLTVAAAGLTPGQYEYTTKMNMPGMPNMPAQTMQRCLTAKDVSGNKAFEMPADPNSDCKIRDMAQSGSQFSYKMSCTKPQKLDSTVKGTFTATGMTMDTTTTMPEGRLTMTQTTTAKRIGDCKQ